MKALTTLIICLLMLACHTTKRDAKRLEKIEARNPTLFEEQTRVDTFYQVKTITKVTDTIILQENIVIQPAPKENFRVETDDGKVSTEVNRQDRDTIIHYEVLTKVLPDTIEIEVRDTTIKVVTQKEVITKIQNKIPFWVWVALGALSMLSVLIYIQRKV